MSSLQVSPAALARGLRAFGGGVGVGGGGGSFAGGDRRRVLARLVLLAVAGSGSTALVLGLRSYLRTLRRMQRQLAASADANSDAPLDASKTKAAAAAGGDAAAKDGAEPRSGGIGVNRIFFHRLVTILRLCVPRLASREAAILAVQLSLLVSRTFLTQMIASVEGQCAEAVTTMNWPGFGRAVARFALISAPASIVNAGLKWMQALMTITFRWQLAHYLHTRYMTNRAYYAASVLGGLKNADQRLTDDVDKFCAAFAELFSYSVKPLLDIVVFTGSIARAIGWRGQLALYAYFLLCSVALRGISPPFGLMTAQESALSGALRSAHSRVQGCAEEIAFNDPPAGLAERRLLDARLSRLLRHMSLSSLQKFVQSVADGYFVKYTASVIGLSIFALPFYLRPQLAQSKNLTNEYIRVIKLMMNTAAAIGQLTLAYKRVMQLAGYAARVSELLEQVKSIEAVDGQRRLFLRRVVNNAGGEAGGAGADNPPPPSVPPKLLEGDCIRFEHVTVHTPDGSLLVRDLNFDVPQGTSVIILGPNGSGKSSLLRVLAELWPLESGHITRLRRDELFFLSQRPYIFDGTLWQQLLYPTLARQPSEAELRDCLERVGLDYLLDRYGWHETQEWEDVLSGGERQRLAMARLLYHRPRYAVLDECTSAVSADGEQRLYEVCRDAGVTMLSIAHRPSVQSFHQVALVLSGDGHGGWERHELGEDEPQRQKAGEQTLPSSSDASDGNAKRASFAKKDGEARVGAEEGGDKAGKDEPQEEKQSRKTPPSSDAGHGKGERASSAGSDGDGSGAEKHREDAGGDGPEEKEEGKEGRETPDLKKSINAKHASSAGSGADGNAGRPDGGKAGKAELDEQRRDGKEAPLSSDAGRGSAERASSAENRADGSAAAADKTGDRHGDKKPGRGDGRAGGTDGNRYGEKQAGSGGSNAGRTDDGDKHDQKEELASGDGNVGGTNGDEAGKAKP